MKKQYIFLIMIMIILFLSYIIGLSEYKDYKRNENINYIKSLIAEKTIEVKEKKSEISYLNSKAYINKVRKEQQSMKNKGEKVIYLTSEKKYKNYTKSVEDATRPTKKITKEKIDTKEMSIPEKWMYFLFWE